MRKTKKERLLIAKKARATHKRNIKSKISYLEHQLETVAWRLDWIKAAYSSENGDWIAVVKEDLAPAFLKDIKGNTLTNGILPIFSRRLRDSFFSEPKQYSFEWWLIDTGKKSKRPDWNEVFAQ